MPLSPSDVQYLNQLLDRRLKNHRGWSLSRYVTLAVCAFVVALGVWMMLMAWQFGKQYVFGPEPPLPALTAKPSEKPSTQPVTLGSLELAEESAGLQAKYAAMMAAGFVLMSVCGSFLFFLGTSLAAFILSRWNLGRQERILITLLREKCAAELALPPAPAKDSSTS